MTDWRSNDDPARGGQPTQGYGQGAYAQGDYAQDPNAQDQYGQGQYGQPPYGQGQYGQSQYPQTPYSQGQYAQPAPYGYPAPAYGYPPTPGYAPLNPADRRPGTITSAAVLGYVAGGLLIIAGIICLFGASTLENFNDDFNGDLHDYSVQFVLAGVVNLIAAGLLIAGSVSMTGRSATGRVMYSVGCGLVIVAAIYWIARWATKDGLSGLLVYALLFSALVIVGVSLAFTGGGNRWFAAGVRR